MAYVNKQQDHEKRRDQEGSYSPYNHIYNYMLNNYEPGYSFKDADKRLLLHEYTDYCLKGGSDVSQAKDDIKKAIENFKINNGEKGDTAKNLGNRQQNSVKSVIRSLADLKW